MSRLDRRWSTAAAGASLALALALSACGSGSDSAEREETTGVAPVSLSAAVDLAAASLPADANTAQVRDLIGKVCTVAEGGVRPSAIVPALAQLPAATAADLARSVRAIGDGAQGRCPDDLAAAPDLVDDLALLAQDGFVAPTTSTTVAPAAPAASGSGSTSSSSGSRRSSTSSGSSSGNDSSGESVVGSGGASATGNSSSTNGGQGATNSSGVVTNSGGNSSSASVTNG